MHVSVLYPGVCACEGMGVCVCKGVDAGACGVGMWVCMNESVGVTIYVCCVSL